MISEQYLLKAVANSQQQDALAYKQRKTGPHFVIKK